MAFGRRNKPMRAWSFGVLGSLALAGIVLAAGIVGDNPVKVQDPVQIEEVGATSGGGTEASGVIYNDKLSFNITSETYPAGSYEIRLRLNNRSEVEQVHRLTFDVPDGFRLSRNSGDQGLNVTIAQSSPSSFLYSLSPAADGTTSDDDLVINIQVLPQVFPGWYTISASTAPLSTSLWNPG